MWSTSSTGFSLREPLDASVPLDAPEPWRVDSAIFSSRSEIEGQTKLTTVNLLLNCRPALSETPSNNAGKLVADHSMRPFSPVLVCVFSVLNSAGMAILH